LQALACVQPADAFWGVSSSKVYRVVYWAFMCLLEILFKPSIDAYWMAVLVTRGTPVLLIRPKPLGKLSLGSTSIVSTPLANRIFNLHSNIIS